MKTLSTAFFLALVLGITQIAYAQQTKWRTFSEEAISLYKKGEYDKAVAAVKKSLAIAEKEYGPDHPDTATSLNNLAELYRDHKKFIQAEPLYKRAAAIREKHFGPDHSLLARTLNGQAELYRAQNRFGDAEPLYKRALAIRKNLICQTIRTSRRR
jgi:tetratricopeptide (TPR) repeat protein